MSKKKNKHPYPTCGGRPVATETQYGTRWACCENWAWGNHPLVDAATHEARKAAHAAFDLLWKRRLIGRSEAYQRLAAHFGLTAQQCHMKKMDRETALRVPAAAHAIRQELP